MHLNMYFNLPTRNNRFENPLVILYFSSSFFNPRSLSKVSTYQTYLFIYLKTFEESCSSLTDYFFVGFGPKSRIRVGPMIDQNLVLSLKSFNSKGFGSGIRRFDLIIWSRFISANPNNETKLSCNVRHSENGHFVNFCNLILKGVPDMATSKRLNWD